MEVQAINIFAFEKEVTDTLLETNIQTTCVDSHTLQLVANANESLTFGWLSDQKNEPNPNFNSSLPPNTIPIGESGSNCPYLNPVYNKLYVDIMIPMNKANPAVIAAKAAGAPLPPGVTQAESVAAPPAPGATITINGKQTTLFQEFENFFNNTFSNPNNQDSISDALIIQVSSILGNSSVWPAATDKTNTPIASGILTEITSLKSTIDSLSQEEEQTGKTDSNMEQSVISLDGNNPSNYTTIYASEMEGLDVVCNILAQGG